MVTLQDYIYEILCTMAKILLICYRFFLMPSGLKKLQLFLWSLKKTACCSLSMPSQAHSEPQFSVLHGDQVPAGMAVEEIGTQMVPPREGVLGCGPTREHLVTRLALCQSPRAGQHGADSEEEASGILPVRHSYCLSARHTPGTKNLGCAVLIPGPLPPPHSLQVLYFLHHLSGSGFSL